MLTEHEGLLADVQKIAVLRANGLGDCLFTLPAITALRAAYPDAEIVWLGRGLHHELFANRPSQVDRVVVLPAIPGVTADPGASHDPALVDAFVEAMREESFDLALQLHGGGRYSNPLVQRLGARVTAGLKTPDAAPLDRWAPYINFQSEIVRYLEVVSLVGAVPQELEPSVAVTMADLDASLAALPAGELPLVVLHVGAGAERRRWPPERFAALGDQLVEQGAQVVLVGTDQDQEQVEVTRATMTAPVVDLCGCLDLSGLVGLLARSALVISNDSGPLHLAAAAGTATVGIFWCGNLITAGPLMRSRHRQVLSWRLRCPQCGRDCTQHACGHDVSLVADIPMEAVLAPALELLEQERSPDRAARAVVGEGAAH